MKKVIQFLKKSSLLSACIIMLSMSSITAQDVISVDPGFNTLYDAVVANPGATFLLQRGGSYVIDQVLVIDEPTIFIGESGPVEEPPAVISLFADPGLAAGQHFFNAGADLTLKNIGVHGFTFDEQQASWAINVASSGVSILLDSCVFQQTDWILNTNAFNGLNIEYRNCHFYNLCHIGWDNWGGYGTLWGGDTIEYKSLNNTWVHSGRIFGCTYIGPNTLETMDHNTYVNIWGELYYPSISDGFVCTNNIMFNPAVRGYVGKRVVMEAPGDTLWSWPGDFSDFTSSNPRDSLQGDIGLFPSLNPETVNEDRNVVVANNLRFTDEIVRANQALATASLQPLMNDSVMITFEKYGWTYENNINDMEGNSVDPEFACGPFPAEFYEVMHKERMERHLPEDMQGEGFPYILSYLPLNPNADPARNYNNGEFQWPLPFDLKPTNEDLWEAGSDGYPLGDLKWFGPEVLNAWYAGDPNPLAQPSGIKNVKQDFGLRNYPNPAASSTTISYTLQKGDKVSLKIYNTIGTEIATLVNGMQSAGTHQVIFNTSGLASGIYFYKIEAGKNSQIQKLMVGK
jgi:hypothetical protein